MTNGEKEGKTEIQKFQYHVIKKNFLVEMKSIFCNYLLRDVFWGKKKNSGHNL